MESHLKHLNRIAPIYCELMEEIKRRDSVARGIIQGQGALPTIVAYEVCYLQLRKICEIIGLGCVVAHGDLASVKSNLLQREYSADRIIKRLELLKSDFYPQPSQQVLDPSTKRPIEVVPIKSGFLTKARLLSLYGECGNALHRGNVRQLLSGRDTKLDFGRLTTWLDEIALLLNHHQIQMSHPDLQLWVIMQSKDDGKVHGAVMQKHSGTTVTVET